MSAPLLILRPLDGALQTEKRARELGSLTVVDPLFTVEPVQWSAPAAQNYDGLLLTSANAVVCGGAQLDAYQSLPVLAVGQATAQAAEENRFNVAETGQSGGQQLLDALVPHRYRSLLWLAGEQHSTLDAGERRLDIVPVYRSRAMALGERAVTCLQAETIVLIHSARAGRQLVSELDRLKIEKSRHHAVVFSAKVAEAAGQGWRSLHISDRPDDESLLSLATGLCQSG